MDHRLASIFPGENNIPAPFQLLEPIEQREYLVNGEMKVWQGNLNPVLSPVFVQAGNEYKQKIIGSTPLLTSKESLEALGCRCQCLRSGPWAVANDERNGTYRARRKVFSGDACVAARGGETANVGNR